MESESIRSASPSASPISNLESAPFIPAVAPSVENSNVEHFSSLPEDHLPFRGNLSPSLDTVKSEMDQIMGALSMQFRIAQGLRPRLSSPDVVGPAQFHDALSGAAKSLEKLGEGADPRAAYFLAAKGVLEEEQSLRDLFLMYRRALLQA